MRIDKTRGAVKRCDVEGAHLLFPAPAILRGDVCFMAHEIGDGRLAPKREVHAEEFARAHAGKRQRGFPQGFARKRAGINSGAADLAKFFHQRGALAKKPGGICSGDSGRSAADYDDIELLSHFCYSALIARYFEYTSVPLKSPPSARYRFTR